jgi:hypothetical protein
MTARDGYSCEMDAFALDPRTAERLMRGSVDTADAPHEYRAVAGVLQALREALETWELTGEAAVVDRIATVVVLEGQARSVRRRLVSSLRTTGLAAAAAVACALPLTGGLASAGALPEPAQDLASTVFGKVGIAIPTGGDDPADHGPSPTSSPPASPSTTAPNPDATPPSVGTSGPGSDTAKSPPGPASPSATGTDEGDPSGSPAGGAPPQKPNGQDGAKAANDGKGGDNGNGPGR